MNDLPETAELLFTDARGIYIPRDFATYIDQERVEGVAPEDYEILRAGPEGELYWDTWTDVLDGARLNMAPEGAAPEWATLYQDGDLWLVPEGAAWPDDDE